MTDLVTQIANVTITAGDTGGAIAARAAAAAASLSEAAAEASAAAAQSAAEATEAIAGVRVYDTFAQAEAAISGLPAGAIVEVMADETLSGLRTRYLVESPAALAFRLLLSEIVTATASGLRSIPYSIGFAHAQTLGCATADDNGGGLWYWDANSTATDNLGTVIQPMDHTGAGRWLRVYSGPLGAPWFGANASAADNTSALQAALNAGLALGAAVYLPHGTYVCTGPLSVTSATGESVTFTGDNITSTVISGTGAGDYVLQLDTTGAVRLENLTLLANSTRTHVLRLNKALSLRSQLRSVFLGSPAEAGLYAVNSGTLGTTAVGGMLSASVDNLHCSGGKYGIYTDNANAFGAVQFNKVRISNTSVAAVYLRNPNNNLHRIAFTGCAFEGNNGQAINCVGGIMLTIDSSHFEQNLKVLGAGHAEIGIGGGYAGYATGIILTVTNCMFGSTYSATPKTFATLTATTLPADGDTVLIGDLTYTFKTALSSGPTVAYEVLIGATYSTALANLSAAIAAGTGAGTVYGTGTVAHTYISASTLTSSTLKLIGKGSAPKQVLLSSVSSAVSFNANAVLTLKGPLIANDRVTIGATTYKFVAGSPAAANDVAIGASPAESLDNLKAAVNASGTPGVEYGSGTTANAAVTAGTNTDTTQAFTVQAGTTYNTLVFRSSTATANLHCDLPAIYTVVPRISIDGAYTVVNIAHTRFGTSTSSGILYRYATSSGSSVEIVNTNSFPQVFGDANRYNFWPPHTGSVTFGAADTYADVSLSAYWQNDANYLVFTTVNATTGTPAAGSTTVTVSGKATTGFRLNLSAAPGTGNTVTVAWQIQRPAMI